MNVKHLRKQLMAAIAMVVVAGVALSSATYAWFVSNNSVTATTTSIAAQSNSAYLVIQEADNGLTKTDSTSTNIAVAADTTTVKLYPAQVVNGTTNGTYKFESAYASAANASTEKTGTRFTVDDGSADKAVAAGYAHKDTFYIGTGGYDGEFSDLVVKTVEVSAKVSGKEDLVSATRVLIVCGDYWCVWRNSAEVTSYNVEGTDTNLNPKYTDGIGTASTKKAIAETVKKDADVTVDVYVFYDGADSEVNSDNLADLQDCGVTITFEATAKEYKAAP